jgi:3-isopropylmalate/(R)-2-methylmalate dehydratase small subunit
MEKITGRVWVFGDDIDTDLITPGPYVDAPIEEMVKHVLEAIKPNFSDDFDSGDIIVAGKNFGCGSSRETAPEALRAMGVGAIVARSYARIFFRNAIALGIPLIVAKDSPGDIEEGDTVEIDFEGASVINLNTGAELTGTPLYEDIVKVVVKGGMIPLMKEIIEERK